MTCGYCGHVHRECVNAAEAEYSTCACGCDVEGWRYENGPSLLDSPMVPVPT